MLGPSKADYSTKVRFTVLIPYFGDKISLSPMTLWGFRATKWVCFNSVANLFPEINEQAANVPCGYVDMYLFGLCLVSPCSMT
jgi:hypothetical protein